MPSIASQYTPLESLLLFQSVARHGLEASSFSAISQSLTNNSFLKEHNDYDANRLSPSALRSLFDTLIQTYSEKTPPRQNGVPNEVNPRKRKLSPSPALSPRPDDPSSKVPHIISQLYNRYSDQVFGEIREQEGQYQKLSTQVESLQIQVDAGERPSQNGHGDGHDPQIGSTGEASVGKEGHAKSERARDSPARNVPESRPMDDLAKSHESKQPAIGQMLPPRTPGAEGLSPRPLSSGDGRLPSGSRVSPVAGPITQNQPSQSPRYSHGPSLAPTTGSPRQSNVLPPLSSLVLQPPPLKSSPGPRKSGTPAARTSPLLPSPPSQYQPPQGSYGYQYPPQWQQYGPNTQYPGSSFYQQPYQRDQAHPPFYPQYPYGQAPPNQYPQGPFPRPPPPSSHTPQFANYPWPGQPNSASATPSARGRPPSRGRTGPTTPWTPGIKRHPSSERPQDRDVSPLSDRGVSPTIDRHFNAAKEPTRSVRSSGRGSRPGSAHSSTVPSRSRSQSALSEAPQRAIKPEGSSTPAMVPSDSEQRSIGRRRGRINGTHPIENVNTASKRKQDAMEASPTPSLPTARPVRLSRTDQDPSLVSISKNFARMAIPTLNDVNRHKVASIFTKPITEREAPGYHDLIFRPQDLKSIRAAVARGSRAANLIIEHKEAESAAAAEAAADDDASPAERPTYHTLLVPKTPDLCPPLAIVNSAQMETELTRIFANAIMFNPLPAAERALPGAYDTLSPTARLAVEPASDADAKGYVVEDDGSIVRDTREMFASVEAAVRQWRSLEGGYVDDGGAKGVAVGLRGGSVSVTMSDAPDGEGDVEDEARASKRRRVGE